MSIKFKTVIILLCQVIHGDLAARNILLSEQMEVKIGDFGLSRQLIDYSNYVKKTQVCKNSIIILGINNSEVITFCSDLFLKFKGPASISLDVDRGSQRQKFLHKFRCLVFWGGPL